MTAPSKGTVQETAAMSVVGATVGACATAVTTTAETLDLTEWKNRYVKVYVENADFYYAFIDEEASTALVTAQSAVGTAAVVDRLYQGVKEHMIVPADKPLMKFRTVSGTTGIIRIIPC